MATDLDLARARIAELESALRALSGFTPDDNALMRRAQEAEKQLDIEVDRHTTTFNELVDMGRRVRLLEDARDKAFKDRDDALKLAEARKYGVASPPPAPIHYPGSDAADALRYMMESRYVAPNPDLIKTVYGVDLATFSRILAVDVRS